MSDSEGTTSPNDNDVILQHVMTLIDDNEDGTTLKIIKHAGVKQPLDILMHEEAEFEGMKAKIGNKSTTIPFRNRKLLVLFQKFHIYRQAKQLPHHTWPNPINLIER